MPLDSSFLILDVVRHACGQVSVAIMVFVTQPCAKFENHSDQRGEGVICVSLFKCSDSHGSVPFACGAIILQCTY